MFYYFLNSEVELGGGTWENPVKSYKADTLLPPEQKDNCLLDWLILYSDTH